MCVFVHASVTRQRSCLALAAGTLTSSCCAESNKCLTIHEYFATSYHSFPAVFIVAVELRSKPSRSIEELEIAQDSNFWVCVLFLFVFISRRQLILNRAAPTLVRSLESGQSRGLLQETSTIAVASMAKQFVGDLVEEGGCVIAKCTVFLYGHGHGMYVCIAEGVCVKCGRFRSVAGDENHAASVRVEQRCKYIPITHKTMSDSFASLSTPSMPASAATATLSSEAALAPSPFPIPFFGEE